MGPAHAKSSSRKGAKSSKEPTKARGKGGGDSEKKRPASKALEKSRPNSSKASANKLSSTSTSSSKRLKSSSDTLKAPPNNASLHETSAARGGGTTTKRPVKANSATKASAIHNNTNADNQVTYSQNGIRKISKVSISRLNSIGMAISLVCGNLSASYVL